MNKLSLAGVTLIAAIPGAYFAYLMVMLFLSKADKLSGAFQAVAGLALLMGAIAALLPLIVLIFGPKSDDVASKKKDKKSKDEGQDSEIIAGSASKAISESGEISTGDEMILDEVEAEEVVEEDDFLEEDFIEEEPDDKKKKKNKK